MSEIISKFLVIICLICCLSGCTGEAVLMEAHTAVSYETKDGAAVEKTENTEETGENVKEESTEEISVLQEVPVSEEDLGQEGTEDFITVHICGAVENPGVYTLPLGARLYEGIEKAGGFREDSDGEFLNLASKLEDGVQIIIPTLEEADKMRQNQLTSEDLIRKPQEDVANGNKTAKVNINTADESLLCTLPGIGVSRARSIIEYRRLNGSFKTIEDIMKVAGIKEAAYQKIKDFIVV